MKYMLMFCRDESRYEALDDDHRRDLHARYAAFGARIAATGRMLSGEILEPAAVATTVRVRGGARYVTDGPFAETVEALLGFVVMECDDLDQALAWAAQHPDAEIGAVEVRPLQSWKPPG